MDSFESWVKVGKCQCENWSFTQKHRLSRVTGNNWCTISDKWQSIEGIKVYIEAQSFNLIIFFCPVVMSDSLFYMYALSIKQNFSRYHFHHMNVSLSFITLPGEVSSDWTLCSVFFTRSLPLFGSNLPSQDFTRFSEGT